MLDLHFLCKIVLKPSNVIPLLLDKHKILLHLSIFYEYQQFFSTLHLFLDTAATSTRKFT
jgi:hypothetical protein